jgi:hypothetical protein
LKSAQTPKYIPYMVQDTLNEALHMIEGLLAKCEQGKDSRALSAHVGAIMESVEAAHSESVRDAQSTKRAFAQLNIELERSAKLEQQIATLIKTSRPPIFLPPFASQPNPSR